LAGKRGFVQPLFVPDDGLSFTFGDRLDETRRDEWWEVDEENPDPTFAAIAEVVRRDALPFFRQLERFDNFCAVIPRWAVSSGKTRTLLRRPGTRIGSGVPVNQAAGVGFEPTARFDPGSGFQDDACFAQLCPSALLRASLRASAAKPERRGCIARLSRSERAPTAA
jgi:hypothetical protein